MASRLLEFGILIVQIILRKTRMCEFHAKVSEFLARRRCLFVGSPRTGEVRQKTINRPYGIVETSCVYQDFVTIVQQMLSSSVPVKTVTISPKGPEFITPLVKMLLRKRYRLRRKGRVDVANVVAQQTSMAVK